MKIAIRRQRYRRLDDHLRAILRFWNKFDEPRLHNLSIPPLAEWSESNYLGDIPPTTD